MRKRIVGGMSPCSFTRVYDLPATLAYARSRHGVYIYPTLAPGSDVDSATVHPVRINFPAHFTNSDLLEASSAFLVRYDNTSCDSHSGQHR